VIGVSRIFLKAAAACAILVLSAEAHGGSTGDPESCTPDALQLGADVGIRWEKIGSDAEAIACVRQLSAQLDPASTGERLKQSGFYTQFIKQFGTQQGTFLLSATWPIHTKGRLHSSGAFFNDLIIGFFAYSESFSIRWGSDGKATVSHGYTYK
jgi:hypothetical protein